MHSPTLPDDLAPFEVFPGRELVAGRPLVARLSGRRFDLLLDGAGYTKPFDPSFGKGMVKTLSYLLSVLGASFGFAEQTELSLFAMAGGGDARRLLSRIAGEASGKLSLVLGMVATFETRLYQLEDLDLAVEYFRWRHAEAQTRAVDRYCQFVLGQAGTEASAADRILSGLGLDDKVELLRQNGLEFGSVPAWQRHGAAIALHAAPPPGSSGAPGLEGSDPPDEAPARLVVDLNLPDEGDFGQYVRPLLGA